MNYIDADANETIWDANTTEIRLPIPALEELNKSILNNWATTKWDELIEANTSALNNWATTTNTINNWATTTGSVTWDRINVPTELNRVLNYRWTWEPAEDFFEYYKLDDDILKSVIKNWKEEEDSCELEKDNFELPNVEELIS